MYYYNDDNFDPMRFENDEIDEAEKVEDYSEEPFVCPFMSQCPFTSEDDYLADDLTRQPNTPPGPPPSYIPNSQNMQSTGITPKAVDPGAIRICRYKYTYIWETNGREYWAYITFVGPRSIAGYRWNRRSRRWIYFGLDLRRIESFVCR